MSVILPGMLDWLFRRPSRSIPALDRRGTCLRPLHFAPLVGFLVPSVAIGYGIVLPRAGLLGINELAIGYASTLVGAAVTYVVGVLVALRR
jgi:hypothetical protein